MPRSLAGRLLVTAAAAIALALLFASLTIGAVLERFVTANLDDRLDAQIALVARAIRPDGRLDPRQAVDVPPFDQPGSGWAWEVRTPAGSLRSQSLGDASITPAGAPPDRPGDGRPRPFEWRSPGGRHVHGRRLTLATPAGPATIAATAPRFVVERPLRAALTPLLLSLLLLGGGLALAIVVQLRFGLRPLGDVQRMLAAVRAGERRRVEATEPAELLPLIAELNALIDANEAALARARGHAANLAHGLKTPLAALRLDLDGGDPQRLSAHVDRIDRHIRHHLARARAATPAAAGQAGVALAPHVADLVAALSRIHAERGIAASVSIADGLMVRCDPQDLDEMMGNLLDNAWRWARGRIEIGAARDGQAVALTIADDGPGLAADQLVPALEPGRRLDERGDGHGFGLAITRELAELYGGALALSAEPGRGLFVKLTLPASN